MAGRRSTQVQLQKHLAIAERIMDTHTLQSEQFVCQISNVFFLNSAISLTY